MEVVFSAQIRFCSAVDGLEWVMRPVIWVSYQNEPHDFSMSGSGALRPIGKRTKEKLLKISKEFVTFTATTPDLAWTPGPSFRETFHHLAYFWTSSLRYASLSLSLSCTCSPTQAYFFIYSSGSVLFGNCEWFDNYSETNRKSIVFKRARNSVNPDPMRGAGCVRSISWHCALVYLLITVLLMKLVKFSQVYSWNGSGRFVVVLICGNGAAFSC